MYSILRKAFECALPMKAYPSMPTPISSVATPCVASATGRYYAA